MTSHLHAKSFAEYTVHLIPASKNDNLHAFKPTLSSTSQLCVHAHWETYLCNCHLTYCNRLTVAQKEDKQKRSQAPNL
jgi:hypothetical protein